MNIIASTPDWVLDIKKRVDEAHGQTDSLTAAKGIVAILKALEEFRLSIDALEEMLVVGDHEAGIEALAEAAKRKLG